MRSEFEREVEIFESAIQLPIAERIPYLDDMCRDAPAMRERLERLINVHESTSASTTLHPDWVDGLDEEEDRLVGTEVEGFRIVSVLGEGGMGVVYEAEQLRPERKVALKVIRPIMITPELMARFEREARLLGRLQHPGIAQIYEVGSLDSEVGPRPYFAMELVEGETLLKHVHVNDASTQEKLELLARIADAVDHAHRRQVIHRDLKPQNVMVDSLGQPKVLDFGIARMTDQEVRAETLQTKTGQVVGTLPYMSPEQIVDKSTDLDARTDVWALGVMGYELLTGRLPIPVAGKGIAEAARMIVDDEPGRLSSFSRTFRGDVETIFTKALEKDRERRYASAAELAADLRAHLRHEPIKARPAGTWYQLKKFASRNQGLVTGVVLAFLSLSIGLIISILSAREAEEARRKTLFALADAEEQAIIAKETVSFLTKDLLSNADPYRTAGRKMTLQGAVDRATAAIESRLAGQPIVEAAVRQALGFVYYGIGHPVESEIHLKRALELAPNDDVVLPYKRSAVKIKLGDALNEQRKCLECIEVIESVVAELDVSKVTVDDFGSAYLTLGHAYEGVNRFDDAMEAFEKAKAILEEFSGADSLPVLNVREFIVGLSRREGTALDAVAETRDIYEKRAHLQGLMHPMVLRSKSNLGRALMNAGHIDEALKLGKELEDQVLTVHGPDHLLMGTVMRQRSDAVYLQGRFEDSVPLVERSIDIFRGIGQSEFLANSLSRLSYLKRKLGRRAEAASAAQEAHALSIDFFGKKHLTTIARAADVAVLMTDLDSRHDLLVENEAMATALAPESETANRLVNDLAMSYWRRGELESALGLIDRVVANSIRRKGENDPNTARAIENRSNILHRLSRSDEAERELRRALAIREQTLPAGHPDIGRSLFNLGIINKSLGDLESAADLTGRAVVLTRKAFGDAHPDVGMMARATCDVLREKEDFSGLVTMARLALSNARSRNAQEDIARSARDLGVGLMASEKFEDAEEPLFLSWELEGRLSPGQTSLGHSAYELGRCLLALEEHEEALEYFEEAESIYANWQELPPDLAKKLWNMIADCHEAAGNEKAAATWRDKAP